MCGEEGRGCAYLCVIVHVFNVFIVFKVAQPTPSPWPHILRWIPYCELPLEVMKLSLRNRFNFSTSDFSVLRQEPRKQESIRGSSWVLPQLWPTSSATTSAYRMASLPSYVLSFPDHYSYLPDFAQPLILISVELETGSFHSALGLLVPWKLISRHCWAIFMCLNRPSLFSHSSSRWYLGWVIVGKADISKNPCAISFVKTQVSTFRC